MKKIIIIVCLLLCLTLHSAEGENKPFKEEHNNQKKEWGRAFLQLSAIMGVAQANYWMTYGDFRVDWQYELSWEDQTERFFTLKAWKFDDNIMKLNWTHSFSGATYYNVARTNNLSWFESFLFASIASSYWEHVVEWREVISVNDMIFTPWGGHTIGEGLYQTGHFFHSRPGISNNILGFIFNPMIGLKRIFYPSRWRDYYASVYCEPWHDVSFSFAYSERKERQVLNTGCDFEFFPAEKFLDTDYVNTFMSGISRSEIKTELIWTDSAVSDFRICAETDFCSYYFQKGSLREGVFNGIALLAGLGSGFDVMIDKENSGLKSEVRESDFLFSDKIAVINVLGPVFNLFYIRDDFNLRFRGALYLNFSTVTSEALNKYSDLHIIPETKSTLQTFGYYYAFGSTVNLDLRAGLGCFDIRAGYRNMYFNSVEGIDRNQAVIEDELPATDSRMEILLSAGITFNKTFRLGFVYNKIRRRGSVKDISDKREYSRYSAELRYSL